MNSEKHGWAEYWQASDGGGEVFVNAEGRQHPALAGHWQPILAGCRRGTRIIDLAAGAGSVFAHLPAEDGIERHAVDSSPEALRQLEERFPGTQTTVADVTGLPFPDESFDVVVSQFGVEYGGVAAFGEAARLVAGGGQLAMLCHIRDGYIDARSSACLAAARRVLEVDFIDRAIRLTEATFGSDRAAFERAAEEFKTAERVVAGDAKELKTGVHFHLYGGFRQLYERRRQYDAADITGWLKGMREDVERDVYRLSSMHAAALDRAQVDRALELCRERGLVRLRCEEFRGRPDEKPVAWKLAGERD